MKIVSFSLWGADPKYLKGAMRNSELVKVWYPGWKMVLFHDDTIPEDFVKAMIENGVDTINCTEMKWCHPSMWRFLAHDLHDCERFVSRDCDSRPEEREKWAVDKWIESDKAFHIMRDHPFHGIWPIQAGMFGVKKGFIFDMNRLIRNYRRPFKDYGYDQDFLRDVLWQRARTNCLQHGDCNVEYPGRVGLPPKNGKRFIGERFDQNEQPNQEDRRPLGD